MQIDENYRIEKDFHSWNLIFEEQKIAEKGKKKGEEYTSKREWYYPNITACLMGYVSQKIDPNNQTVKDVLNQLTEIKVTIEKLLKEKK
jgi:hypothetical protein